MTYSLTSNSCIKYHGYTFLFPHFLPCFARVNKNGSTFFFLFWLLQNTRHTVGIHNICAWFNSKNCLFVCGWLREHITPVILCKDLPACLFSPPSIFPSPLRRVTENTVARCLGAQSGTTPAKGENGWRRGGGEKGGPVYAVVARHKGPPTHSRTT